MTKPIVLLVRNAAVGDFGGAERYPASLAQLIAASGEYTPILVTRSQKLLDFAHSQQVATRRGWWLSWQNWNGKYTVFFPLYILWQLVLTCWYLTLLIRTRAVAVHLQSKDDFIAGTLAAKLLGRTVVWTDHMDLRYIFENVSLWFKNPLGKLVLACAKLADHIIIISDNERRLVTSHFKDARLLDRQIVVIKNGVVDTRSTLSKRPSTKNEVHFCLVSRITLGKGVADAIDAFLLLDEPTAFLDIYGEGPDKDIVTAKAVAYPRIRFHGHTNAPLQAIYDSDVYVLPSYQEGLSIALLEATMLGMPIIASDVDSNPEVIDGKTNGLLIPPGQPAVLAAAMKKLLDSPSLRRSYGEAARSTYEHGFNLETIVSLQIQPLYKMKRK